MADLKSIPFWDNLRGFQKSAARWLEHKNGTGLLADPMGSGKTIEAMTYLALHPELRPVLVIPPATVKLKWEREVKKWMPEEDAQVVFGLSPFKVTGSIIIINWDIIFVGEKVLNHKYVLGESNKKYVTKYRARDELADTKWAVIIGDEIHKISNNAAGRTVAFKQVCKNKKAKKIVLSGTPIENRPINFFNILKILDPKTFMWRKFTIDYCDKKHNGFGWNYNGSSNTADLHHKVKSVMLRRDKSVILPDLPPLQRTIIPLELDNKGKYRKAEKDFIQYLRDHKGNIKAEKASAALHLARFEGLKQLAVQGIIKSVIKWVEDYLESGEKLVIGCIHRDVNEILYKKFKGISVQIIGGISAKAKESAIYKFQNNPKIKLAVCNIIAAGEGIDLYAANSTLTIEYLWKPGPHDQFEARVHRIGQEADSVNAYYLIAAGTVMEDIAELIDAKRKEIDAIIDGIITPETSLITELMKRYKDGA